MFEFFKLSTSPSLHMFDVCGFAVVCGRGNVGQEILFAHSVLPCRNLSGSADGGGLAFDSPSAQQCCGETPDALLEGGGRCPEGTAA